MYFSLIKSVHLYLSRLAITKRQCVFKEYYTITDFCRSEYEFLLTMSILVLQVNTNSYSLIQKSVIVLFIYYKAYDHDVTR